MAVTTGDVDVSALADLLKRKSHVRGEPVALTLFHDEIHPDYMGRAVEPCAIVHHAMDLGERVYVDATHQACLAGAWQAGFLEPAENIRDGSYLSDSIPGFLPIAANRVKTGENVLPQGLLRGIGAAPLAEVPAGVPIDTLVVVCEPVHAATLAGVRTAVDGTPPRGAAGSSLCGELFAIPWHDSNVIMTPGDMGGRMFNKVRPNEMFVIIPMEFAGHLFDLLRQTPDVPTLMEVIKPGFLEAKQERLRERAQRQGTSGTEAAPTWDDEAAAVLAKAPAAIAEFAGPTLEEYALEHGHQVITLEVMHAQMESVGMRLEDVIDLTHNTQATRQAVPDDGPSAALASSPSTAIDHGAPIHAEASITIDADRAVVWAIVRDIAGWSAVYDEVKEVAIDHVAIGTSFSFRSGPGRIEATVASLQEGAVLTAKGKGMGATSTLAFHVDADEGGTTLRLGQSISGMAVRPMKRMLQGVVAGAVVDWANAIARRAVEVQGQTELAGE